MADVDSDQIVPTRLPDRPIEPWVRYNEVSDTLMIYFFGPPEPAVSYRLPGDRHMYLRLAEDDYSVIGAQIEGFTVGYLQSNPQLIELARALGVAEETLQRIETEIGQDTVERSRERALAESIWGQVERELVSTG